MLMFDKKAKVRVVIAVVLLIAGLVLIAIPIATHSNIVRREAAFIVNGSRTPNEMSDSALSIHLNKDLRDLLDLVDSGGLALYNEEEQKRRTGREAFFDPAERLVISLWEVHREDLDDHLLRNVFFAYLYYAIPSLLCLIGSVVLFAIALKSNKDESACDSVAI